MAWFPCYTPIQAGPSFIPHGKGRSPSLRSTSRAACMVAERCFHCYHTTCAPLVWGLTVAIPRKLAPPSVTRTGHPCGGAAGKNPLRHTVLSVSGREARQRKAAPGGVPLRSIVLPGGTRHMRVHPRKLHPLSVTGTRLSMRGGGGKVPTHRTPVPGSGAVGSPSRTYAGRHLDSIEAVRPATCTSDLCSASLFVSYLCRPFSVVGWGPPPQQPKECECAGRDQ